jgi:ubiquinone/menaquinone biosynthesis C-methylase UbiE
VGLRGLRPHGGGDPPADRAPAGRGLRHPRGQRVLDVGAGTGNASLPAAARGAHVTASDLTPELLEVNRRRAGAQGLELESTEADAEHRPFEDESFDVVMSAIGSCFPGTTGMPLTG